MGAQWGQRAAAVHVRAHVSARYRNQLSGHGRSSADRRAVASHGEPVKNVLAAYVTQNVVALSVVVVVVSQGLHNHICDWQQETWLSRQVVGSGRALNFCDFLTLFWSLEIQKWATQFTDVSIMDWQLCVWPNSTAFWGAWRLERETPAPLREMESSFIWRDAFQLVALW